MKPRAYIMVSATIFAVVAVAHAARAVLQLPAHLGAAEIPMLVSWVAILGAGLLSIWGFSVARRK